MSHQVSNPVFTLSGSHDTDFLVAGQIYRHTGIGHDYKGFNDLSVLGRTCRKALGFVDDYFSYLLASEHPAVFYHFKFEVLPALFPNSYIKVVFLRLRSLPTYPHSNQIPLSPADEKNRLTLAHQMRSEIDRAAYFDAKEQCLQVCQRTIGLVESEIQKFNLGHPFDEKSKLAICHVIDSDFGLSLRIWSCLDQEDFSFNDLPRLLEVLQAEVSAWK